MSNRVLGACALAICVLATNAFAQTPAPVEKLTFTEAVQRAIAKNPSSTIAAAGILRADALLREARSSFRPQVSASVTETTLNTGVMFQGLTVTPQNSVNLLLDARMSVYAPAAWAARVEAQDQRGIAELSIADTNRQTALATADAFLTIIARRRAVAAVQRARDTAGAHFDLARQLEQGGTGSRLNSLRAQQELSTDEGLVESAQLGLYRAQEALGVLVVADGPVDAADEPDFGAAVGATSGSSVASGFSRTDLKVLMARQDAAERLVRNATKQYFPTLQAIFQPQTNYPKPLFGTANSWRLVLQASISIYDSGLKSGVKLERESALDISRATLMSAMTSISSDVRSAREAVASAERSLTSATAAASQAQDVVNIVNISFRAGASTNIEVIDAERSARDADTAAAVAEDTLRRARLDLLNALGRFP
jgi:outer membrane protein TolC